MSSLLDVAVVGGGAGGVTAGALLASEGQRVALFERLGYLGGCAGTFVRDGYSYNAGATTFVGLSSELPLGVLSRRTGVSFPVVPVDPAICVHLGGRTIRRYREIDRFIGEMERAFPGFAHRRVFREIDALASRFWPALTLFDGLDRSRPASFLPALLAGGGLFLRHARDFFRSTRGYLESAYGGLSPDLLRFFDHQLLITAQAFSDSVPLFAGILGLSYPNLDNHYVMGGMGAVADVLAGTIQEVRKNSPVRKVSRRGDRFILKTAHGEREARNCVLNRTIWDLSDILDPDLLQSVPRALRRPRFHDVGAFVLYFMVEDLFGRDADLHHQIILPAPDPVTGGGSFFLSLSHPDDPVLTRNGMRSVTISTHTPIARWRNPDQETVSRMKKQAEANLLEALFRALPLFREAKRGEVLSGTPGTFARYTARSGGTVGGLPVTMKNFPLGFPTPVIVPGLYLAGDTVFPGQGWPGVTIGSLNLLGIMSHQRRLDPN